MIENFALITTGKSTWRYLRRTRRPTVGNRRSARTFIQVWPQIRSFFLLLTITLILPCNISISVSPLRVDRRSRNWHSADEAAGSERRRPPAGRDWRPGEGSRHLPGQRKGRGRQRHTEALDWTHTWTRSCAPCERVCVLFIYWWANTNPGHATCCTFHAANSVRISATLNTFLSSECHQQCQQRWEPMMILHDKEAVGL